MIKISEPHILDESLEVLASIFKSGHLVHGPHAQHAEHVLSDLLMSPHAILVSSGTAALHLALIALDIGSQDAVLVPNMTFPATINVVHLVGARPVLVDVDPQSYVMTTDTLQSAIDHYQAQDQNNKSPLKAIMVVHEFGYPADMQEIMKIAHNHGLKVIEDAACAITAHTAGKAVGTWGDIGCFSFHPRKIITCGEGGLVTCQSAHIAQRIRRLKNHGIERNNKGVTFVEAGFNYRLTDFQAALLVPQLKHVTSWITQRRSLAHYYHQSLTSLVDLGLLALPSDHLGHVWQSYVIRLSTQFKAHEVSQKLKQQGIESNCGAQILSTLPSVIKSYDHDIEILQSHTLLDQQTLALPLCENYDKGIVDKVVDTLQNILNP
jgi:perosamine synthetase